MQARVLLSLLLVATLLVGCVSERHKDVHGPLPPPPSESLRGELGTVRVVSSLAQPGVTFVVVPESGISSRLSGAGKGAGRGATIGCVIVGGPPTLISAIPLALIGCAGGATIGAISGAIYGAIAVEPPKTVEALTATVRHRLMDPYIQQRLQDHVRELIPLRTTVRQGETKIGTRLQTEVLSIELDGLPLSSFSAFQKSNPSLRLVVTAQVRLIRMDDGTEPYVARFQYWGPRMTLSEWANNDAQAMQEQIDYATVALAEQIVDGVFLLYRSS